MHDSIETMSCERYHKYEKMMILDGGVGGDYDGIANRLNNIMELIERDPKKAMLEVKNLGQTLYFMENDFMPKMRALACRVESVDGEPFEDMSDDGIGEMAKRLEKMLNVKELDEETLRAKKKIDDEMSTMFSGRTDAEEMNLIEARLMTMLDAIVEGRDVTEAVKAIDDKIWQKRDIVDFGEWDVAFDKSWEKSCLRIGENLHLNAKAMTQMEYESAIEMMVQDSNERKNNKKH